MDVAEVASRMQSLENEDIVYIANDIFPPTAICSGCRSGGENQMGCLYEETKPSWTGCRMDLDQNTFLLPDEEGRNKRSVIIPDCKRTSYCKGVAHSVVPLLTSIYCGDHEVETVVAPGVGKFQEAQVCSHSGCWQQMLLRGYP